MPTISVVCGVWGRRDVELTDEQLKEIDQKAYEEHNQIMRMCIADAVFAINDLKEDTAKLGFDAPCAVASALFAMRARPIHYIREEYARAKFMIAKNAHPTQQERAQ